MIASRKNKLAPPVASFMKRVSIDPEVRTMLSRILMASRLASDVTAFARKLGYVFSEQELSAALEQMLNKAHEETDRALSDSDLDAVVGGAASPFGFTLPPEIDRGFRNLLFTQ